MAKGARGRRRMTSRNFRPSPYPLPSIDETKEVEETKCSRMFEKKDWEDVTCSVCMECPHKAVLLLCSSHDKGCRPYMCGTSFRYSNCFDEYKKAYTKVTSCGTRPTVHVSLDSQAMDPLSAGDAEKLEVPELACPLCRGQVKAWTIVEPARDYLNAKKRSCTQDNCSFVGTYKELRKHVKADHPYAKPREVDPALEQKWTRMERERDTEDVISTIRSSMPGAVIFGDYVIEGSHHDFDSDDEDSFDADALQRNGSLEVGIDSNLMRVVLFLQAFGSGGNAGDRGPRHERESNLRDAARSNAFDHLDQDSDGIDENEDDSNYGMSLAGRLRRQGTVLLGQSGRRRRRREANTDRR